MVSKLPGPGRRWLVAGIAAMLAAGAAGWTASWWRAHRQPARIAAALPTLPELQNRPAEFQSRLARARAQALRGAGGLDGVAELGRLCQANGFPRQAEACWRLLRSEEPRNPRWCYYLADLRRLASDYAAMAELLTRTTVLAPTYAPAWLRLADLQFKSGQLVEAEAAYRRRLALLPGDPYASLGLARIALQQGRRQESRERIQQLVKDAPAFPPGHNLYAEILAADGNEDGSTRERVLAGEAGRFREAPDPWLDELIDWCFDSDQLCVRGTVDDQTKFGDRGKSYFERAIQLRPHALLAYELLGNLYLELDDAAKAREIYETGLRQARDTKSAARYYASLGRVYCVLNRPEDAIRIAREGLAQAGKDAGLYHALGSALADLGQNDAAVKALQSAASFPASDAATHYDLAVALLAVHRLDEAVDALHRSIKLEPSFPAALALLAQIEIDSGRWATAVDYLRPLYDSHPELPEARLKMTSAYLRAGEEAEEKHDLAAAEKFYRAGLAIEHDQPDLQARLQHFREVLMPAR